MVSSNSSSNLKQLQLPPHQTPTFNSYPSKMNLTANISPDPPTPTASDPSDLIDLQNETYHSIPDLIDSQVFSDPPHENYHLIPTSTANTGLALSDNNLNHDLFEDTSDLLFDPTNYLHFTSD